MLIVVTKLTGMTPRPGQRVDKIVALAAAVALGAIANSYPSAAFAANVRDHHAWAILLLLATSGVFTAIGPIETLTTKSAGKERIAYQHQILSALGRMLDITKTVNPPLETADLGLHLWRRKRSFRYPVSGRLERVATYRLGGSPVTLNFRPAKGVGVVGLCWKENRPVGVDVTSLSSRFNDEASFESHRRAVGTDAVMGMTWKQFQDVAHRGAVFASPVRDGQRRFIGCVSADARHGYHPLVENGLQRELDGLASSFNKSTFRVM
jgi:hypothetical protein